MPNQRPGSRAVPRRPERLPVAGLEAVEAAVLEEPAEHGADGDVLAAARHARLIEIEYELADKTAAAPGAGRLLDQLFRRNARVGILTRNTREIALHTLGQIGLKGYFTSDDILGRDEAAPKPHPEGIEKLLAAWGSAPDESVMVGDYLFDLQVGRAAGTATIHVDRSRAFRWPELADLSVATLDELAEAINLTEG